MPLETATYISDLVASNPAASDALATADDHLRIIKGALKATFPNWAAAALNSTQAQVDAAVSAAVTNGVAILSDTGTSFKTNTDDKITNPAHGEIDLTLAGTLSARFVNTSGAINLTINGGITTTGGIAATGAITGPGTVPIGGMVMWLTDTLPTGAGVWCWANGGVLSRTGNGAALFALTGTAYGTGDGSTTFNVINMCETAPVGKSTMGGATSRGLLTGITTSLITTLGSLFGVDKVSLGLTNLPSIPLSVSGTVSVTSNRQYGEDGSDVSHITPAGGGGTSVAASNAAYVSSSGSATLTGTAGGSATAFEVVQPSTLVNYIIRIG